MRKFKFSKLFRDKIVDQIIVTGNIPRWRTLSSEEYIQELRKKIEEEAAEIPDTKKEELISELADLHEVIDCLLEALKVTKTEFLKIKKEKTKKPAHSKKDNSLKPLRQKMIQSGLNTISEGRTSIRK